MKKLLTFLIIGCSFFFAGQVKADSTIFLNGFEEGSVAGNFFAGTTGTVVVTTTNPRSGSYSLYMNGSGAYGRFRVSPAVNKNQIYCRTSIYFTSFPANRNDFFSHYSSAPARMMYLDITSGGKIEAYDRLDNLLATSSATLSLNTRYEMETATDATANTIIVKIDGTEVINATGDINTMQYEVLGANYNATEEGYEVYFDDTVCSDTSAPDVNGKIIQKKPASDGSFLDYTLGTGTDYTQVNSVPPTTASFISGSSTLGQIVTSTFGLESNSSVGISGTINSLKIINYGRSMIGKIAGVGANTIYDGTNWLSSVTSTISNTTGWRLLLTEVCPNGSACTASGLDSLQIGAFAGDGITFGSQTIYDTYVSVFFTPSVTPPAAGGGFIWIEDI